MREIFFDGAGGPEVIRLREAPVPVPGPGQVLVEVGRGGHQPAGLSSARRKLSAAARRVGRARGLRLPGASPPVAKAFQRHILARRSARSVGSGGYAEYAVADGALCLPVPRGLSLVEAAGIPETYFTVFDNVFTRGRLKPGETILVHGGSSGIGSTAIQLAKLFGAHVIVTAGSPEKLRLLPHARRRSRD